MQSRYESAFTYFRKAHETSPENSAAWRAATLMYARYMVYRLVSNEDTNRTLGVQLLQKLADDGYAEAFFWVGDCYETGTGVEKDLDMAFRWYMRSAEEAKDADAKARYEEMCLADVSDESDDDCRSKTRNSAIRLNRNFKRTLHVTG
ncbi:hypothetical protein BC938DRAFT_480921 [Jimgerdemannia flammicorona]|uniref:Uncharacterized protein n=1 Tax=Jimgerdemannia flammicorona TaxID=994334 RepID=A0A433QHB4_9FUNG|nr:hypothetical protein BC938DRAFT_480921 [Jimgerdemannia flammicorona]